MRFLASATLLALLAQPASAQQPPPLPKSATLSADMEASLKQAGFTDLQIMPNSVFVRGKDKAGQPVAMVLHPGSMTEMVTLDPHTGSAAGGNGAAPLTGNSTFVAVLPNEKLATRVVGTDVVDKKGETLGTIRDIAIDHGGVHAYILSVGGLFGLGERFAAVTPTAIDLTFDPKAERYHATMDATIDQIKAAPEFKYRDIDQAAK